MRAGPGSPHAHTRQTRVAAPAARAEGALLPEVEARGALPRVSTGCSASSPAGHSRLRTATGPEGAGSQVQLPPRRRLRSPRPPGIPPRHGRRRLRAVQTLRAPARVSPRWLCPFPFRDARRWVLKPAGSRGAAWRSPRTRRAGDLAASRSRLTCWPLLSKTNKQNGKRKRTVTSFSLS